MSVDKAQTLNLRTGLVQAFKNFGLTPRQHQIRTVGKIICDVASYEFKSEHEIRNYLIQHTAGSGKSLTIATLVLCLEKLKNGKDRRGFDLIIVLNDRIVLDEQLSSAVVKFLEASHVKNVVQIDSANALSARLASKNKGVIVTTFQKFMSLKMTYSGERRIAIIADEAHRTHGNKATDDLHQMLVQSAAQSELITYFSFTCSPTEKTIQRFGTVRSSKDDDRHPFYSYSVEESIRDGLTLNVLSDFTHVPESTLGVKSLDADGLVNAKAIYIINHFVSKSKDLSNDKFVAKGMLVVKGRDKIIQYKKAIDAAILKLDPSLRFDILCTFTPFDSLGSLTKETDLAVNGNYANQNLIEVFKDRNSKVKLIIVAEKLQTGFDAPTLTFMYIDKKMKDTALVQTLGRLSRVAEGKNKVCVVDFQNSFEDSRTAFEKFSFEPEDDKAIDKMIDHAHEKNKIIENLVADLHGIVYTDDQREFLKMIKKVPYAQPLVQFSPDKLPSLEKATRITTPSNPQYQAPIVTAPATASPLTTPNTKPRFPPKFVVPKSAKAAEPSVVESMAIVIDKTDSDEAVESLKRKLPDDSEEGPALKRTKFDS